MNNYNLDSIINWCFNRDSELKIYNYKYHSHNENYVSKGSLLITFYSEILIDDYISYHFLKNNSKRLQISDYTFVLNNVLLEIRLNKLNKILNED